MPAPAGRPRPPVALPAALPGRPRGPARACPGSCPAATLATGSAGRPAGRRSPRAGGRRPRARRRRRARPPQRRPHGPRRARPTSSRSRSSRPRPTRPTRAGRPGRPRPAGRRHARPRPVRTPVRRSSSRPGHAFTSATSWSPSSEPSSRPRRAAAARPEIVRWSPADELRLLVVHGALHLCGWDHAEPAEEAAMRALEASSSGRPSGRGAGRLRLGPTGSTRGLPGVCRAWSPAVHPSAAMSRATPRSVSPPGTIHARPDPRRIRAVRRAAGVPAAPEVR